MKIAYVTAFYSPAIGGVKQVVEELAERLVKDGHEIHVYCSDSDKYKRIKKKEEIIKGVHVHRCFNWFTLANFATFWPSLLWKLWREDFDLIHTHVSGHSYVFFAALIAKLKGIAHVHTTHCCWTEGFRSLIGRAAVWLDYRTVLPLSFRWTDKIIAITPWEVKHIKKWGGDQRKIDVIPNGMDEILLKKIKNNKFKKKYGVKDKLVLFFGRLNPTKGPDKLAIVGNEITTERKDIDFMFVGPDEGMMDTVAKLIKGKDRMHLIGPIRGKDNIAEMYQAADLYVLPSYREGLPLTLFEAMAAGLPIVASPVNGIPYEMKDPENGLLIKYGDLKNLKKAILKMLDDQKYAQVVSKNNIKKSAKYNWNNITKRTMEVYQEAISLHQ